MKVKSDAACRDIRAASTESEVVSAVRRYLGSLDAGEVALLPAEIMTLSLSEVEEIVHSALQLLQREMLSSHEAPEATLLREVSLVFCNCRLLYHTCKR